MADWYPWDASANDYAPTRAPDARWSSWPESIRAAIPSAMSGDYVAAFGVPWAPGGFGQPFVDHSQPMAGYGSLAAYNAMQLRNCGLARVLAQDCGGEAFGANVQVDWQFVGDQLKQSGQQLAKVIAAVAPFIGVIPGLGQGVAAALMAASALAMGRPLDDAVLDVVSNVVPGGALAKAAFQVAAQSARGIIEGEALDQVAIDAARRAAIETGGPAAGAAFDAGVALARGQALQDAGFAALQQIAKGSDLAERAGAFSDIAADAIQRGQSIKSALVDHLVSEVSALDGDYVRAQLPRLVDAVAAGGLAGSSPEDIARRFSVPVSLAWGALASIRPGGNGTDESVMKRLLGIPGYAHLYTGNQFTKPSAVSVATSSPWGATAAVIPQSSHAAEVLGLAPVPAASSPASILQPSRAAMLLSEASHAPSIDRARAEELSRTEKFFWPFPPWMVVTWAAIMVGGVAWWAVKDEK